VRDVLLSIERSEGRDIYARLEGRLPERLRRHVVLSELRAAAPTATIPLDEGEELLLAVDAVLGDGSGRLLENAALEVASRVLSNEPGVVQSRDLMGTVARMRAALERPFSEVATMFELCRTDRGFSLTLGVRGRPRSAKLLRHLAAGFVRAADRFALETSPGQLRIFGEVLGDRASVSIHYRNASTLPPPDPTAEPPRSISRPRLRATGNLTAEVERILSSTRPSPVPPERPSRASGPRRAPSSSFRTVPPPAPPSPDAALPTPADADNPDDDSES
jgi:hypothetical protein